ncbi:MAG: glutamine-hydrolyzing carbamoyl-phosphate synthase small subunit [Deltaproteobacteria bacterium]|nr:MAG: glutamine-hydrolyzing carbamoyl-phosphate synthase small subunit [Deltaproteobacteria bacterium]
MGSFNQPRVTLVLEDGRTFYGRAFAGEGETLGEVVFNTSMTGYQEVLSDPSYKGQIVVMTYPLIGNYGVNDEDMESVTIQVEGFIVREYIPYPSNWRSKKSLKDFLEEANILGVEGIDTRALTKHIRTAGAMKGIIATGDRRPEELLEKVQTYPGLVGRDLVSNVTTSSPYLWQGERRPLELKPGMKGADVWPDPRHAYKVVALDYGIKYNILRHLANRGCHITVLPAQAKPTDVLALKPDGLFLSNGPGDPAGVTYAIETVRALLTQLPIFGICLGHQLLGLAMGGTTFKLKFGHRGGNQPVKDLLTGKVEITSQNHGFCVDINSLKNKDVELTHINLNDQTLEGMRHRKLPIYSVQYHPEASPGPHDSTYLFDDFLALMKGKQW